MLLKFMHSGKGNIRLLNVICVTVCCTHYTWHIVRWDVNVVISGLLLHFCSNHAAIRQLSYILLLHSSMQACFSALSPLWYHPVLIVVVIRCSVATIKTTNYLLFACMHPALMQSCLQCYWLSLIFAYLCLFPLHSLYCSSTSKFDRCALNEGKKENREW